MPRVLILGIGNPLRGDDGLGPEIARRAAMRLQHRADIEVLICHQLTPELAARLAECDHVLFVDADSQNQPGKMHRRPIQPTAEPHVTMHALTPGQLLGLARSVCDRCPSAELLTVAGEQWELHEGISSGLTSAIERAVDALEEAATAVAPASSPPNPECPR